MSIIKTPVIISSHLFIFTQSTSFIQRTFFKSHLEYNLGIPHFVVLNSFRRQTIPPKSGCSDHNDLDIFDILPRSIFFHKSSVLLATTGCSFSNICRRRDSNFTRTGSIMSYSSSSRPSIPSKSLGRKSWNLSTNPISLGFRLLSVRNIQLWCIGSGLQMLLAGTFASPREGKLIRCVSMHLPLDTVT